MLITQKDIARKAGVSQPAVGLAFREDEFARRQLRPETRERIRAVGQQLGYVPHHAARSLRLGKTHTIAMISSAGLRHPHVHETIELVRLELARHGYHLSLDFAYQPADEKVAVSSLASGRCDGAIWFGIQSWARTGIAFLRKRGLPLVALDPFPDPDVDTIGTDYRARGRLAAQHLLAQGHRTIATVVGLAETGKRGGRVEGCRQALHAVDATLAPLVFYCAVEEDGRGLWTQLQSARPRPTAAYVYNDELAVRLVQAVLRGGARVPEDLAVVTDGNTWVGRFSDVPITSVDSNHAEQVRLAVARLLERMKHPTMPPQNFSVQPFLVERQSSQFKR